MAQHAGSPALSILMVNWNTREMTLECLRSLYAETHETDFEVVMIDNDSADGSADAIAAEFPQVRLIRESANHGFARATNMAAEMADGRYLLLLNTDTVVLDGAIDHLMVFAASQPDAKIWGGRTLFGDRSLNPTSCWGQPDLWSSFSFAFGLSGAFAGSGLFNPEGYGDWKRDSVRQVDIVTGCLFLIERDFWRELSGFDTTFFMYGEEADLCARARALGAKPMITPESEIVHYGGASAAARADKIIYVFGSRIGLIDRHMAAGSRSMAKRLLLFAAWFRATAYALARFMAPGRYAKAASEWREVWMHRALWKSGPLAGPVKTGKAAVIPAG
jgi:GT2 family glycosyltransferase